MKRTSHGNSALIALARLACAAFALVASASLALTSCAKPATDAEIAQAYNFYIESPETLSKIVSTASTDKIISETIANGDESCVRKTEINQADGTSKITVTFKNFKPKAGNKISMNGEIVISSLANVFAINGSLEYANFRPARLVFRNATLTQIQDENGTASFTAKDGSILADKREIGVDEFFNKIMK